MLTRDPDVGAVSTAKINLPEKSTFHMTRLLLIISLLLTPISIVTAAETELTGTLLVANRTGGSISVIDLQTKTEVTRLPIGEHIPHEMAASPDGRWAITGAYGTGNNPGRHLVVIDIATAEIVRRIDMGPNTRPHSIVFLSDSRHVITTIELSNAIALVDIIDGEIIRTWPTGGQDSHMVRIAPDDSRAYVASRGSGTLSVIWLDEVNADRPRTIITTGRRAEGIAVSPDGQQIWVANQGDSTISVVDAETLEVIAGIEGITTNRIEFLPNGQAVVPGGINTDSAGRYITFFDGTTQDVVRTLQLPSSADLGTGVRLLAADDVLFLADSALGEITVVDPASENSPELITSNPNNVDGMAWSPLRLAILGD
jgi:YVTN family beta-propeller protein